MKLQSVMERPDLVRRVMPPRTINEATPKVLTPNHRVNPDFKPGLRPSLNTPVSLCSQTQLNLVLHKVDLINNCGAEGSVEVGSPPLSQNRLPFGVTSQTMDPGLEQD